MNAYLAARPHVVSAVDALHLLVITMAHFGVGMPPPL